MTSFFGHALREAATDAMIDMWFAASQLATGAFPRIADVHYSSNDRPNSTTVTPKGWRVGVVLNDLDQRRTTSAFFGESPWLLEQDLSILFCCVTGEERRYTWLQFPTSFVSE